MKLAVISSKIIFLAAIILFSGGCSDNPAKDSQNANKVNEDELIGRLSTDLIAKPRNQQETDQNLIVNYAIDNNLNVQRTPSGLYVVITEEGTGEQPGINNKVTAHYRGTFLDGREFDSSFKRNQPLTFPLTQVIRGWQEAIPMLKPGGKATLLVPSHLAYGAQGYPGLIPPNTVLRFDIELISFN